jgi:hypothetical protein
MERSEIRDSAPRQGCSRISLQLHAGYSAVSNLMGLDYIFDLEQSQIAAMTVTAGQAMARPFQAPYQGDMHPWPE